MSLEEEIRNRAELSRTKKKMEGDMSDLEIQAEKYRKQVEQLMETNKDLLCQIKDLQTRLHEAERNEWLFRQNNLEYYD